MVVAHEHPWPPKSRARLRLLTTLHGLCKTGPTEHFSITSVRRTDMAEPDPSPGLEKVGRVTVRRADVLPGSFARPWLQAAVSVRDRGKVRACAGPVHERHP